MSLIVHSEGRDRHRARCHYCNYGMLVPKACPACKGPYLERRGFGTEKVADEISALWPPARVARLDRDTVRRKGAAADILRSMAAGTIDVLVGTQMIAKGHDFPRVTLVGRDLGRRRTRARRFRAAERTFQLLTQVAGRAGRGAEPGEAIVQTLYPNHYSIEHACRQDYAAFFADELRLSPDDAVSAADGDGEHRRQGRRCPRGDDRRRHARATLAEHARGRAIQRAGARARAGREAARRVSRADLSEGQPSREHARGGAGRARRRARDAPARVTRHRSGVHPVMRAPELATADRADAPGERASGPLFTKPSTRLLVFWGTLAILNLAAGTLRRRGRNGSTTST